MQRTIPTLATRPIRMLRPEQQKIITGIGGGAHTVACDFRRELGTVFFVQPGQEAELIVEGYPSARGPHEPEDAIVKVTLTIKTGNVRSVAHSSDFPLRALARKPYLLMHEP